MLVDVEVCCHIGILLYHPIISFCCLHSFFFDNNVTRCSQPTKTCVGCTDWIEWYWFLLIPGGCPDAEEPLSQRRIPIHTPPPPERNEPEEVCALVHLWLLYGLVCTGVPQPEKGSDSGGWFVQQQSQNAYRQRRWVEFRNNATERHVERLKGVCIHHRHCTMHDGVSLCRRKFTHWNRNWRHVTVVIAHPHGWFFNPHTELQATSGWQCTVIETGSWKGGQRPYIVCVRDSHMQHTNIFFSTQKNTKQCGPMRTTFRCDFHMPVWESLCMDDPYEVGLGTFFFQNWHLPFFSKWKCRGMNIMGHCFLSLSISEKGLPNRYLKMVWFTVNLRKMHVQNRSCWCSLFYCFAVSHRHAPQFQHQLW